MGWIFFWLWYAGKVTVNWLGVEAIKRFQKLQVPGVKATEEQPQEVRKTKGGAILDPDDFVKDVLDDNDFVSISKNDN